MVKARMTDKGLVQEAGSGGFTFEESAVFTGASNYSGSVVFHSSVTASQGLSVRTPKSGTSPTFALELSASEGSSASANAILFHPTGSAVGTNFGIGQSITNAAALHFDLHFRPVGAGADRPSFKYKVGNTIYVISASTA